jgi:OOP family OmpA-OmpF porin
MRSLRLRNAIALPIVALCAWPLSAQAQRFHGGFGWNGGWYAPRYAVRPYYPYYPPYYAPPIYAAPPAYYYPPPPVAYAPPPPPPPMSQAGPAAQPAQYTVYFEFDHDQLTREASAVVQRAAETYRAGGNPPIAVVGHTDRAGTPSYNLALSQRRAATVRAALVRAGVPADAISISWRGEDDPQVPTPDGAREPQNRRVRIVIGAGATS